MIKIRIFMKYFTFTFVRKTLSLCYVPFAFWPINVYSCVHYIIAHVETREIYNGKYPGTNKFTKHSPPEAAKKELS